ncbi:MAG: hypothetical protein JEZ09_17370 [Salinivirgaceae bacterium]|nr:hypothetical protein [Salinivirgaceae bacterium]
MIRILLLFTFFSLSIGVFAENIPQSFFEKNSSYIEKIDVCTDRDVYCVNELLEFSILNFSPDTLKDVQWSSVVYVEIISCDGHSFFQGKYKFGKNGTQSNLRIPKSILTGNYYLKIYTKWMRNYSNLNYAYKAITIINPFEPAVYSKPEMHISDFIIDTIRSIDFITINEFPFSKGKNKKIELSAQKQVSSISNEEIEVTINGVAVKIKKSDLYKFKDLDLANVKSELKENNSKAIVSIADSCTLTGLSHLKLKSIKKDDTFKLNYYPETRGITLSGSIIDSEKKIPVKFVRVNVTIFDGYTESISSITDSSGRFYFALPELVGNKELFISSDKKNNIVHKVLIDNDFCTRSISLPFIPFTLNSRLWSYYNQLSLKSQINAQYYNEKEFDTDLGKTILSYYKEPSSSIQFDDYIELPTIFDYFYELIPLAGFRKSNNESSLHVIGNLAELEIHDPLVLMDFVAISDIDNLLNVDPGKIKSVEVFNYPYIKGDITYGGIVNIKSKKADLAGIDLPSTGLFFNYNFYQAQTEQTIIEKGIELPNLKNVLYWNPNINISEDPFEVLIDYGDNIEKYSLQVQKIDKNGILTKKIFPLNNQ